MTEDVIYWESGVDNLFHAWYPVTASYELFNIPTDQTSGLEQYDWMTAESTAKASDGGVSLLFDRHLTKVTIEIASWASEFLESERQISGLKVLNLSEVVTNDGKTTGDQCLVSPYVVHENQTYSVLLAPGTYAPETEIIKFQIGNGKAMNVNTSGELTLLAGKAYKFRLNVGKSAMILTGENVSVADWNDDVLEDQSFEDIVFQLQDGTPVNYQLSYSSSTLVVPIYSNVSSEVSVNYAGTETGWISYDDSIYSIYANVNGLNIGSKLYSWTDLGVSKTSVITLTLSGTTMIVNGKTITGIPSVGRYLDGYIWSGHYHERDDGMWWKDYTFQDGGRIYYAKGWNPDGQLIYIGTGALTTSGRVCWRSVYYDTYSGDLKTQDHFPRVTSSFGRGNL